MLVKKMPCCCCRHHRYIFLIFYPCEKIPDQLTCNLIDPTYLQHI